MSFNRKPIIYNNSIALQEMQELLLLIGCYIEKTQFNITNTPSCNIVLGLPQLKESNPTINQSSNTIQFRALQPIPIRRVYDISYRIDVRIILVIELYEVVIEDLIQVQTIYYKKTEVKQGLALDILSKYSDFKYLFEKEANKDALLLY